MVSKYTDEFKDHSFSVSPPRDPNKAAGIQTYHKFVAPVIKEED